MEEFFRTKLSTPVKRLGMEIFLNKFNYNCTQTQNGESLLEIINRQLHINSEWRNVAEKTIDTC